MDFFEKHKALILTLLFCSVLILGLYNFNLSKKQQYASEMMVDLEEFQQEQDEEETDEEQQEPPPEKESPNQQQTHRAYSENEEAREENFNKELEEILEKNTASQDETSEQETEDLAGEESIGDREEESQEFSGGDDTSEKISTQSGGIANSSISYSVKGRNAIHIPNPVYTCDTQGTIVVNIRVNAQGSVTNTSINQASSTSANRCLTEKALEYAAGARFSSLARNNQPGTITYRFKP